MTNMTTTTYPIRSTSPAFRDLHSVTVAIAGVAMALEHRGGGSTAYNPGDYLTFEARAVRLEVRLPLYGPIEAALIARKPDLIELTVVNSGQPAPGYPRQVTGLGEFFDSLVQPRLVSYFQRERDRLMHTASQDRTKWPSSWQMAWAVRNAVSHGGVAFEKPTQKPVSWRGITFGPADEPVRSLTTMLNGGDLTLLMLDMAADLP